MAKKDLSKARKEKNDEFYTMLEEINEELQHYKEFFKNKIVYCNCDDGEWSNFWRFFYINFGFFELKKLIATSYHNDDSAYRYEYNGGYDQTDYAKNNYMEGVIKTKLSSNGDFRSEECLAILDESDIVATNPPFSLFREFVSTMIEHNKKFIIIGNLNAVSYKEVFPHIKDNELWAGYSFNKVMEFIMPDSYVLKGKAYVDERGHKHGFVPAIAWFTNIEHNKRYQIEEYYEEYSEDKYQKYDNYDAIEVPKSTAIPCNYIGEMAVPITWLSKYNPNQFDIIGMMTGAIHYGFVNGNDGRSQTYLNGEVPYARIFIKWKPEAMPTINDGVILYGKQKSDRSESGKK